MAQRCMLKNVGNVPRGVVTASGGTVVVAPGEEKPAELADGTYRTLLKGEGVIRIADPPESEPPEQESPPAPGVEEPSAEATAGELPVTEATVEETKEVPSVDESLTAGGVAPKHPKQNARNKQRR